MCNIKGNILVDFKEFFSFKPVLMTETVIRTVILCNISSTVLSGLALIWIHGFQSIP